MRKKLTEPQQRVLAYLVAGKPVTTQRQLAEACGFDHPQKVVAATMGLVMKGYLRVDMRKAKQL